MSEQYQAPAEQQAHLSLVGKPTAPKIDTLSAPAMRCTKAPPWWKASSTGRARGTTGSSTPTATRQASRSTSGYVRAAVRQSGNDQQRRWQRWPPAALQASRPCH